MSEANIYSILLAAWLFLALIVFFALFLINAPYGRLAQTGFGPGLPGWLGWLLMEAPASLVFMAFFCLGRFRYNRTAWAFLAIWQFHYIYRAFIYPFLLRGKEKRMPVSVMGLGIFHNLVNAYLNARYLFTFSGGYPDGWIIGLPFLGGAALFSLGLWINRQSDWILRSLRKPGESGYHIPYGGLFRWVSCPNYLGEIVQWLGWAIATWSLPGMTFALWTCANLVPRAWAYHRWYQQTFPHYPPERSPLIPRWSFLVHTLREARPPE